MFAPEEVPEDRTAWIALAVVQWQSGRLLDDVRDRALECLSAGADLDLWAEPKLRRKRVAALEKARVDLLSPQRSPTRVARTIPNLSPFLPGDVLRYTSRAGREFALWAMRNRTEKGLIETQISTEFQLAAVGDLLLPSLAEIVGSEPVVLTRENGARSLMQLTLYRDQDAKPPRWEVIGNAPYRDEWDEGGGFGSLTVKERAGKSPDAFFDAVAVMALRRDPAAPQSSS